MPYASRRLTPPAAMERLVASLLCALISISAPAYVAAAEAQCPATYYRLADNSGVDIAPAADGFYRWRRIDGTSGLLSRRTDGLWSSSIGWTGRDDGRIVDLRQCEDGKVSFAGIEGRRVDFATEDKMFASGDAKLAGRLVMPAGRAKVPIIILVHGSEDSSALQFFALQRLLPAQGVGVFVYDKRGTGRSGGVFTHDLHVLAADASTALANAKLLAGSRAGRVGYYGTSQGGWTAPLASISSSPHFIIIGYGLAVSPVEEDREALGLDMTRHGFGSAEVAKALEIGGAAQAIVRSNFQSGYATLRELRSKYEDEPWFRYVRGNITGLVLQTPEADLRVQGPQLFAGLIPDYDPMPVLRRLKVPQLWILGGEDIDAPPAETRRRLLELRSHGHPIKIALYPSAEHGLYNFEVHGEERRSTRQPASLQRLLTAFARGGDLGTHFDDATIE